MGNCLVLREQVIKIVKPDGKILEYRAPMKVYQVLTEFSGHAISETASVMKHLKPETKLLGGHLYYLVRLPLPANGASKKKKVRFSDPEMDKADAGQERKKTTSSSSVVRIKLVISKQELQEMLRKGGISVDDMVSKLHNGGTGKSMDMDDDNGNNDRHGWKPALESIPEGN
ncbi:hypothetical protein FEM48_Zijuj12G0061600 [Ziziphus jujuba var. spinosa]|uniref:Uncharacterized protein n=1 Tax=Ziziphus jujuba var. spinosa TaxID=714518 RepID=A0A978UBM2_ZIZJJ|nr:hypothetical protein FEM48_Zijuj12G0061600 [Ziziphus jujuba var. spinosa]